MSGLQKQGSNDISRTRLSYEEWKNLFFAKYFSLVATPEADRVNARNALEKGFMLRQIFVTSGLYFMKADRLMHETPEEAAENLFAYHQSQAALH